MTILTNGVSFTLVAGAVCFVKFSKGHEVNYIAGKTLNVSSTGAKNITIPTGGYNGNTAAGAFSVPSSLGLTRDFLFIYTGSEYAVPLSANVTYADE